MECLEVPVGRHGSFDTAPASDGGFVNAAPVFPDQDYTTEGDQSDSTIREVPENSEKERSIGAPVSAHDEDDDLLIYTLTGPDAELFRIGRNDGQLKTEAPLNFEVQEQLLGGGDRHRPVWRHGQHSGDHRSHRRGRPRRNNGEYGVSPTVGPSLTARGGADALGYDQLLALVQRVGGDGERPLVDDRDPDARAARVELVGNVLGRLADDVGVDADA